MTVQCPRCSTQYRVPEERLSHRRPTFKCTQCGHVFPAERPSGGRTREPERNLSFHFDPPPAGSRPRPARDEDETATETSPARGARDAAEPAFVAASRDRPKDEVDEIDEVDDDLDEDATSLLVGAAPERKMGLPSRTVMAAPSPRRSPVKPVTIGVAATLAAYLAFAVYLNQRPDLTLDTLSQVPLLGRLIGDDNLLAWRLELVDVEGGLDEIRGRRPAYIVSGRAVNTTGEPLRIIEVEGRLIAGGEVRQRRRAYAANQFKKTVRELSASEVEMLLRLEPNRRFVVQPGESAHFLIVFPDPPPDVTGVECRVVDARTA